MRIQKHSKPALTAAIALAALVSFSAPPASGTLRAATHPSQTLVNVNVSFTSRLPVPQTDAEALAGLQTAGRKRLYGMAARECAFLLDTIAGSCRLTGISVSTQIQHQSGGNPPMLHLSGNAQFAITLKASDR